MPVITGEWVTEGEKLRVWACHYLTDDPGDNPKGFSVASIPDYPPPERGVDTIMYYDPRNGGSFFFESTPRPLNDEELQREANEKIPGLTIAARLAVSPLIVAGEVGQQDLADLKGLYVAWGVGIAYAADDLRVYEEVLYSVIQAHTSQEDWVPPAVPALFKRWHSYGDAWRQPAGAHDVYGAGQVVTHGEQLWQSSADNNSWEPGVYGWVVV